MAIAHRFQKSLFAATTTKSAAAAATGCFFLRNFAASRSQLQPIMLQNRVLKNYNCSYLQSSAFRIGDNNEKCLKLKLRKVGVSCAINSNQPRVLRLVSERNFHPLSSFVDGSRWALSSQLQPKVGFSNSMVPWNIFGSGFGSPYSAAYAKRPFSHIAKAVVDKNDNVGVRDGKSNGKPSLFKVFNKNWTRAKSLAAHKRNGKGGVQVAASKGTNASASANSPSQNTDMVNTRKKLIVDGMKDASLGPSVSSSHVCDKNKVSIAQGKQKQQSKSKEQHSGGNAASDATAKPNKVSQAKGKQKQQPKSKEQSSGTNAASNAAAKPNKVSQAKGKQKQPSKSKEQRTGTNAASDAAAKPEGSVKVSQSQKPNTTKKNQASSPTPKHNSTGNIPLEVLDSSVSTKQQSERAAGKSHTKGKSVKEANAGVKVHDAPQVSSGKGLTQIQKPQASDKVKPQRQRTKQQFYPPMGKSVLVVESVTKAKVIQGYLGDMFEVLPTYGHVRGLAARSGSVRPDDDFSMVWEVPSPAWTHLKSIKVALSGAENLILASDPDREGEAIAWHIIEMLRQQDALPEDITVARVVFKEITESSVKSALQAPRDIDANLVHAYLARLALDYLIGFNISPLLWRKLPGCQSAGRVQSAALSLVCDRETEIDEFKPQEYWTVEVQFNKREMGSIMNNSSFSSHLSHFDSKNLNQLSISSHTEAEEIERKISSSNFKVVGSRRIKIRKNPPTPYITSTLQQDAANKLHYTATNTMRLAQKLFEGVQLSDGKTAGLITYHRTDGFHISDEATEDIRSLVIERYGQDFASKGPRKYFKKVKNAQEAHEAIRPTDIRRLPSTLVGTFDEDSLKLYALIWARTVACQMEPTITDQIQVDIGNDDQSITLRSTCSTVEFLGYQAVYKDLEAKGMKFNEKEANDHNEAFKVLSNLKVGSSLSLGEVKLTQHHTQPPPRYSEGSLVKKLEELGIGRPSTYASTLRVLQDRNYVTVKKRILYPEFRGRMVSAFLAHHFTEVTDYSFTADMETELDNVSAGMTEWKGLLRDYWTRFSGYCDRAANVHIHQVEKMLEKKFGDSLFASLPYKNRTCPSCSEGTLIFKVGRFGAGYFIACDQHPRCKFIAKTLHGDDDDDEVTPQNNITMEPPKLLGLHPTSNEKILLKNGPYGSYIQLGEDRKGYLPKRASVSLIKDVDSITLEDAIDLLRYPVTLGNHPDDGLPVILKLAKFGFSIRHRRTNAAVPKNMKPSSITLEKALKLLSSKNVTRSGRPKRKPELEEAMEAV